MESFSDTSSDSEHETLHIISASSIRENHPRQTGYIQVVFTYSDADFWRHFRVSRATFRLLIDFMKSENFRSSVVYRGGFEPLENYEMLLITLQYLGNQGAIRVFADKFNRTESTVYNCVTSVCKFLFEKQSHFIK